MNVLKRKNRTLSLRLTDEEYQRLRQDTVNRGARSVSDFARDTLCHVLYGETLPPHNGLEERLTILHTELRVMNRELDRLRRFVGLDAQK